MSAIGACHYCNNIDTLYGVDSVCAACLREVAPERECEVCFRPSLTQWCPRCSEDLNR